MSEHEHEKKPPVPAQETAPAPACAVPDTEGICPVCGAAYRWEHAHQICPRCKIPQSCCN